jgi:hypothetical protein
MDVEFSLPTVIVLIRVLLQATVPKPGITLPDFGSRPSLSCHRLAITTTNSNRLSPCRETARRSSQSSARSRSDGFRRLAALTSDSTARSCERQRAVKPTEHEEGCANQR